MNNFGNSPGGMKRPLSDPRQRLQQPGRFGHGRGQQQHFPPRHQQPMRRPGPGGPQQHGRGGGRGYQPPLGAPGRGFPMHHHQQQQHQNQQQAGQQHHMGHAPVQQQHQQHQFQSGPGRGGFPMNRGQPAPPPPTAQQQHPPFRPSPAMNNSHNRMHNTPPQPNMGAGYGQHVGMNPMGGTPSHRQPYQNQNQHGNPQHHQHQYPPHSPPPGRHPQPVQQQTGMVPSYHSPQHQPHQQNHFQQASSTNQYAHSSGQPPLNNHHVSQQHQQQQQQRSNYAAISSSTITKAPTSTSQQYNSGASASTQPNTNASTSYTKAQIGQAWSEHTNKGVKYYHNAILQTSTYEKPQALMTSQEIVQQQQQQQQKQRQAALAQHANNHQKGTLGPATVSAQTTASSSGAWTEYTDTKTGKKYYSDGVTTSWEKPAGFVSASAIVAQSNAAEEKTQQRQHQESSSAKKKRKVHQRETPFRNSDEAVAAFKGLLLAKGVSPTQKWNEVVKMCSSDARWDDCEAVLTTGERKQGLAEYQTKRFNELKDQERQERARAKDAFSKLLSEVLPKLPAFSVLKTRFSDIRDSISKDDRFYAVPTESDRETLYLDFCEELRKHDERKKRNKKREAQDSFCLFLKEKEEAGILKFSSTWNSFLSSLNHSERDDSRFKVSSAMSDPDRQLYFADFVIELQAQEDDKRRRIRDARRRAEKAQRDAYRDALERMGTEGKVTPSSHWRDVQRLVEGDSSYESVLEQDRDAPREIFEEFIDEWDDIYRRDRQFLSQLVHPSSNREILVTRDTKYDAFVKALLEEANNSPQTYAEARRIMKTEEPRSSARLYFDELVNKAKEKAALPYRRRSYGSRRGAADEDSSEDEGEIIEDGEVDDKKEVKNAEVPRSEQPSAGGNRVEGNSENAPTCTSEESTIKSVVAMEQHAVENAPSAGDASIEKLSSTNVEEKLVDTVPAPSDEAACTTNPKEAVDDKRGKLTLQVNNATAANDNSCDEPGHPVDTPTPCDSAEGSNEKASMHSAMTDKTGVSAGASQGLPQPRSAEADLAADRTEKGADAAMKENDNEKEASRTMEGEATASNQLTSNESSQGKEGVHDQQRTPDLTAAADEISATKVEDVVDNSEASQAALHTTTEATEESEPVPEPSQISMHSSSIGKPNEGSSSELCIPASELSIPTNAESSQSALPNLTNEALDDPRMVAMAAQSAQSASNVEEATEEDALYLQAFLTDEAPDEIEALQHHTMGMPS